MEYHIKFTFLTHVLKILLFQNNHKNLYMTWLAQYLLEFENRVKVSRI